MNFKFVHNNFNVLDLQKSLAFYKEALGLEETRRIETPDFTIVYLGDHRKEPYSLGDNEFHLAFETDDFAAAHAKHEKMGCICFENPAMGIYFITDPDNYWLEILPPKK